jgi:hypothetical protein
LDTVREALKSAGPIFKIRQQKRGNFNIETEQVMLCVAILRPKYFIQIGQTQLSAVNFQHEPAS